MLPMFVFISSYVFSFKEETIGRKESIWPVIIKKAKRLYLPSILFSLIYIPLAPKSILGNVVYNIQLILNGIGHMWFLPMLFWCFPILWLLFKIRFIWLRFAISFLFAIAPTLSLPLQVGAALNYSFYFLLGYELYKKKNDYYGYLRIVITWLIFITLFIGFTIIKNKYLTTNSEDTFITQVIVLSANKFATLIYSTLGIIAMLMTAISVTSRNSISPMIVKIGTYCFGVYIFQQFILQIIYYHTTLSQVVRNGVLPWLGFIVALIISLLLSYLLRLTKVGRSLI